MHLHFIDKKSLERFKDISIEKFDHDLYYILIICDSKYLNNFNFKDYKAYVFDKDHNAQKIDFTSETYHLIRSEFLEGVGSKIRTYSTTTNAITEYITFPVENVEKFRANMSDDYDMRVKLICINDACIKDGKDWEVTNYLKDARNKNRLSLAFQQYDSESDSNFYDIGNMQP
ncbi:hypothetical protein [Chryseobacterium indoltheticum]|uniref:hypothetical protein n=1 Tax=Chryseobacterium indoltheticum TaxID=254 RepID=UPI003F49767D